MGGDVKPGDVVRLICDHVPGVHHMPVKGLEVVVTRVNLPGYHYAIYVDGIWTSDSGKTEHHVYGFFAYDFEVIRVTEEEWAEATEAALNLLKELEAR
jgi:hypothetical protein